MNPICMHYELFQVHDMQYNTDSVINRLNPNHQSNRRNKRSHCNVEIDDSLLCIELDIRRLHTDVGDINGAWEEEKHSQARKQETQHH